MLMVKQEKQTNYEWYFLHTGAIQMNTTWAEVDSIYLFMSVLFSPSVHV